MSSDQLKMFKQSFFNAMNNPIDKEKILAMTRQMTPNFTEEERTILHQNAINSLQHSLFNKSGPTTTVSDPKRYIKEEYNRRYNDTLLPMETVLEKRNLYYTQIGLEPPTNYEPRNNVKEWDEIDYYEVMYIINTTEENQYYERLLQDYKNYIKSQL
jgi:hypothetical protein